MTELFRCRIDRKLLAEAERVSEEIGITPGEIVRLCFKQMVKRRVIPFPLYADDSGGLVDVRRRNEVLRELDDAEGW